MTALTVLRPLVFDRADGRCEAAIAHRNRCRNPADELHHRLPRRAGGSLLDNAAENALEAGVLEPGHLAHLLALCRVCHHEVAHGNPEHALRLGLRVPGSVRFERWSGRLFYEGPDEQFRALWPRQVAA